MSEQKLLPCPFCGETEHLYPAYRLDKDNKCIELPYAIDCIGCGVDLTPREGMSGIEAWNKRSLRYEALVGALKTIITRSNNGELGTSKVIDMRRIDEDALKLVGGESQ